MTSRQSDAARALDKQLEAEGHNWTELHYCINEFCELVGIPFGNGTWDEHQAVRAAVLETFAEIALKYGWKPPTSVEIKESE